MTLKQNKFTDQRYSQKYQSTMNFIRILSPQRVSKIMSLLDILFQKAFGVSLHSS